MRCILIISFGLISFLGNAQELDSLVLDDVNIIDQRLKEYTTGSRTEEIDQTYLQQHAHSTLKDVLRSTSAVNIRSYGLSGLSTISLRGAGSSHSAILWEGINLQSPSNGSLDLTLVPVTFVDNVSLQYGGGSSLYGSGAIGGSVHLSGGEFELNKPISASLYQQFGSFGNQYTGVNLVHSGANYGIKLRGFTRKADNDFEFYNEFMRTNEVQSNAHLEQDGTMLEGFYKVKKSRLVAKYWLQDNLIHLPKTKGQGLPSVAFQKDKFHRATLQWLWSGEKLNINAKTAYIWHKLIYSDTLVDILSNNRTESIISEVNTHRQVNPFWKLHFGVNYTHEVAYVDGYRGFVPSRDRFAFFTSLKGLLFDKLETTITLRESNNDGHWSPFLPSLGLQYQAHKNLSLKGKASRSFRVPTFNDLYWWQGRNPDLKPERGTSFELGVEYELAIEGNVKLKSELTTFSNYVHDWILWAPVADRNYVWSPENIQEVWSKGLELHNEFIYELTDKMRLETTFSYQWTDTRVESIFKEKSNTIGEQMILTPEHTGNIGIAASYGLSNLRLLGSYIGKQFTDDNSPRGILDSYTIWDLSVSHNFELLQSHSILLSAEVKNLLDHRYDVRRGYPMPGRNYSISVNYQFNK